jgi:hypothetical protein
MGLKRRGKVTGNGRRREERPEIEDDWQVGPTCRRRGGHCSVPIRLRG